MEIKDKNDQSRYIGKVVSNVKSNLIEITEDKLENILLKHLGKVHKRRAWITPFGVAFTVLITILTSDFKEFVGIKKETWQAIFFLLLVASLFWTIYAIVEAISVAKKSNSRYLINEIKNSLEHEVKPLASAARLSEEYAYKQYKYSDPTLLQVNALWQLNHWGHSHAKIQDGKIIFKSDGSTNEDGCNLDLKTQEIGKRYKIACYAQGTADNDGCVYLWCHEGQPNPVNEVKSDPILADAFRKELKIDFVAKKFNTIRIHIQYRPDEAHAGLIEVSDFMISELDE